MTNHRVENGRRDFLLTIAGGIAGFEIASTLIRQIGFDPVVIGGLAMGKYLVPGTPLGGEHTAAEIRQIVTNLH
jgi:predicted dinucleotide-binding enzyme